MSTRVFHQLLAKVGVSHRYQFILVATLGVLNFQQGITTFLNTFLFYQTPYQCPTDIQNCQEYVCTLSSQERLSFVNEPYPTMLSRFGDYRCDSQTIEQVQTLIFMAGVVGVIFAIGALSWFTQRQLILSAALMQIIGLSTVLFSHTLTVATIGLILNFFARSVCANLLFSVVSQSTAESIRINCTLSLSMLFSLAPAILSLIYWLVHPWELAMITLQLVPLVIIFFLVLLVLEDSPFQIVTFHSVEEAVDSFNKIARINGMQNRLTVAEVSQVKEEYEQNQRQKHDYRISVIDLFCFASLRRITIVVIFFRFFVCYCFSGSQLVLKDYALSLYVNGILLGGCQMISGVLSLLTGKYLPRVKTFLVLAICGTIFAFLIVFFVPCLSKQCTTSEAVTQTIGLIIFRFFLSFTMLIHLVNMTELFPTQIKPIALQILSLAHNAAFLMVPLLDSLFEKAHLSIVLSFGVASLIVVGLTFGLNETLNIPPPQIIKQLETERQQ